MACDHGVPTEEQCYHCLGEAEAEAEIAMTNTMIIMAQLDNKALLKRDGPPKQPWGVSFSPNYHVVKYFASLDEAMQYAKEFTFSLKFPSSGTREYHGTKGEGEHHGNAHTSGPS